MSVIHALSLAIELELKVSDAYRRLSELVVDGVVKKTSLPSLRKRSFMPTP